MSGQRVLRLSAAFHAIPKARRPRGGFSKSASMLTLLCEDASTVMESHPSPSGCPRKTSRLAGNKKLTTTVLAEASVGSTSVL